MQSPRQLKERPIILNAHEVRWVLEGRKTQLRRIIRPQPFCEEVFQRRLRSGRIALTQGGCGENLKIALGHFDCPYGRPGDRLWVPETFWGWKRKFHDYVVGARYSSADLMKYPAARMRREDSRILIEIVSVRAERVWESGGSGHHNDIAKEGWPWGRVWPERNPYFDFRDIWLNSR